MYRQFGSLVKRSILSSTFIGTKVPLCHVPWALHASSSSWGRYPLSSQHMTRESEQTNASFLVPWTNRKEQRANIPHAGCYVIAPRMPREQTYPPPVVIHKLTRSTDVRVSFIHLVIERNLGLAGATHLPYTFEPLKIYEKTPRKYLPLGRHQEVDRPVFVHVMLQQCKRGTNRPIESLSLIHI